jgi:hypothetical protein
MNAMIEPTIAPMLRREPDEELRSDDEVVVLGVGPINLVLEVASKVR